jgi:hypothetical protein
MTLVEPVVKIENVVACAATEAWNLKSDGHQSTYVTITVPEVRAF